MAATRKVFFGTLYEFSRNGEEEFLRVFHDQLEDPDQAPVVRYERRTALFSCDIEFDDEMLAPQIITQLGAFIGRSRKPTISVVESPRLKPIECTFHNDEDDYPDRDDTTNTIPFLPEPQQLLDLDSSSGDEGDAPAADFEARYWRPQNGEISILSADTAAAVVDSTGCFLLPEPETRRIKIANGATGVALDKLERLDDVLTRHAKHRSKTAPYVDSNILLSRAPPSSTIKFTSLLTKTLLGEIRVWQDNQRVRPANLDPVNVSLMADHETNATLREFCLTLFGDPANEGPRDQLGSTSKGLRNLVHSSAPGQFLPPQGTKKVNEWMAGIDPQSGANEKPPEPLPEIKTKSGRRRVVAHESDDEDEEEGEFGDLAKGWSSQEPPSYVAGREIDWAVELDMAPAQVSSTTPPVANGISSDVIPKDCVVQSDDVGRDLPSESRPSTLKMTGANMFSLLDVDPDVHDGDAEEPAAERSNSSVRPLNVTFEEPALSVSTPTAKEKAISPRKSGMPSAPRFDPSRYGASKHVTKKNTEPARQAANHIRHNGNITWPHSIPTGPRADSRPVAGSFQARNQRAYNPRGESTNITAYQHPRARRENNLIDVSSNSPPDRVVAPPPGSDYPSLMADSLKQVPARSQQKRPQQEHRDTPAVRTGSSSEGGFSHTPPQTIVATACPQKTTPQKTTPQEITPQEFTPQTIVPKRNVSFLRDQMASQIQQEMARKQSSDERGSRRYHKTMGQKSGRPSKDVHDPSSAKKESKAAKKARIANAKAEAYGNTDNAKTVQQNSQREPQPEVMSARKRQIIKKNGTMAEMYQDQSMKASTEQVTVKLMEELKSILQATRAFKGTVSLQFQLGQAVVLKGNRIDETRIYSPVEWAQLMRTTTDPGENTVFTNILTANGLEMDRLFSVKSKQPSCKLWDQTHPGPFSIEVEFDCRDRFGVDFVITLDRDGKYKMRKSTSPIGQVALHCPTQIWDACAVVLGTPPLLFPSEDLTSGFEEFISSLYVTHDSSHGVSIYHRLPQNEAFVVTEIRMKRVSLHDCLLPNRQNLQLQVTEVKNLIHLNHATDKKLYHSSEEDHLDMVTKGNIHYEAAIIHKDVEKALEENVEVEIGELTVNDSVLTFAQARNLVEVTAQMLEGMDWVGAGNFGTIRRAAEDNANQVAALASTLPPNMNIKLLIPMGATAPPTTLPSVYQTQAQQSRVGAGAGTATNIPGPDLIPHPIHGVRFNTTAELFQEGGQLFYYGLGGARIPVVDPQVEAMRFDGRGPVVPDDSASQIGYGPIRQQQKSVAGRGRGRSGEAEKPAGFW